MRRKSSFGGLLMKRSCWVITASIAVAAALPLSAMGQAAGSDPGSTKGLAGSVVTSPSEPKAKSSSDLDYVPLAAERKRYLLLLAGLGVAAFVASRRRLG